MDRIINVDGTSVMCMEEYYKTNGAVAITVVVVDNLDEFGETYAVLTVNDSNVKLASNEVLVKTWSENSSMASAMLKTEFFEDTMKRVPMGFMGFVEASIWKFDKKAFITVEELEEVLDHLQMKLETV